MWSAPGSVPPAEVNGQVQLTSHITSRARKSVGSFSSHLLVFYICTVFLVMVPQNYHAATCPNCPNNFGHMSNQMSGSMPKLWCDLHTEFCSGEPGVGSLVQYIGTDEWPALSPGGAPRACRSCLCSRRHSQVGWPVPSHGGAPRAHRSCLCSRRQSQVGWPVPSHGGALNACRSCLKFMQPATESG